MKNKQFKEEAKTARKRLALLKKIGKLIEKNKYLIADSRIEIEWKHEIIEERNKRIEVLNKTLNKVLFKNRK